MKIYIDNIALNFQKIGGISVYIGEIISRLMRDTFDLMLIEQNRVKENIIRNELSIPCRYILEEKHLPLRLLSYIPIRCRLYEKTLIHSSYYRICNNALAANIITVYDFNYELGYVRGGIRKYMHCRQKKRAIERADGVICISESTKHDLLELYPHIESSKIKVIHLAAGKGFFRVDPDEPVQNASLANVIQNKKYILFVGARKFHKNFNVCIDTLAKLDGYDLFIVGSELTDDELDVLNLKLPSRYHTFSNISVPDLNCLYNNAFCFFYPTSYEGFGLPVLESMQAGCPLVSTKKSSIPEVAGDAGLLVENISSDDFVEIIVRLEDQTFREQVINAGFEQTKKFSWDKTYQETVEFYRVVFLRKFGGLCL